MATELTLFDQIAKVEKGKEWLAKMELKGCPNCGGSFKDFRFEITGELEIVQGIAGCLDLNAPVNMLTMIGDELHDRSKDDYTEVRSWKAFKPWDFQLICNNCDHQTSVNRVPIVKKILREQMNTYIFNEHYTERTCAHCLDLKEELAFPDGHVEEVDSCMASVLGALWHNNITTVLGFEGGTCCGHGEGYVFGDPYSDALAPRVTVGTEEEAKRCVEEFFAEGYNYLGEYTRANLLEDDVPCYVGKEYEVWWTLRGLCKLRGVK